MVLITPKPAISTGIIIITMGFWVGFSLGGVLLKKKTIEELACLLCEAQDRMGPCKTRIVTMPDRHHLLQGNLMYI